MTTLRWLLVLPTALASVFALSALVELAGHWLPAFAWVGLDPRFRGPVMAFLFVHFGRLVAPYSVYRTSLLLCVPVLLSQLLLALLGTSPRSDAPIPDLLIIGGMALAVALAKRTEPRTIEPQKPKRAR